MFLNIMKCEIQQRGILVTQQNTELEHGRYINDLKY